MNIEDLQNYCMSKKGVTESFPFDNVTLVFKVMDKMFALTRLEGDFTLNLKCEPQKAIELREAYASVLPGYHMNKKHWNTIVIDSNISVQKIKEWIDDSYNLAVLSLTKKDQSELAEL